MSVHLTEEEQMAQLRRWWTENGKSTLVMIALVVAAYLGWEAWRANQSASAEAAGALYQNFNQAVQLASSEGAEDQGPTLSHLGGQLKADYPDNLYASQAALFLAREAVKSGNLDQAAVELQWVIDRNVDAAITLLARSRLARIRMAQESWDAALALLDAPDNSAFVSTFAELRGDILVEKGQQQEARAAYQRAMENLVEGQEVRTQLLQIKLDNLQPQQEGNS